MECAVCRSAQPSLKCARCETRVCSAACARADWTKERALHREVCALLGALSIQEPLKREREREDEDESPQKRGREPYEQDPYARLLNPDVATNPAWIKRFAELDAAQLRMLYRASPAFRYYFGQNRAFLHAYRMYHGGEEVVW